MIFLAKLNYKGLFLVMVCLLTPLFSYEQTTQSKDELLNEFKAYVEEVYKSNDLLVNGRLYRLPLNSNIKGSPYFIKNTIWNPSRLYIKGKEFLNQKVLYNIHKDELIMNVVFPGGTSRNIILDKRMIDSLYIENHFFINVSSFTEEQNNELYEQLYSGNFKALLKHRVNFVPEVTNSTPNGYFTKSASTLFILEDGEFVKIFKKRNLLNHFSSHKKEIARFMRTNKIRLKTAQIHELFNLFKFCDDISN